jgi:apolipoprotein N-acyltransferase
MKSRHYLLALLSGLLLAASYAPFGSWQLAWIALAPLFYAVLECGGAAQAARLGALAGLAFYSVSLIWMAAVVHYLAVVFWAVFAAWLALHAGVVRGLWDLGQKRGKNDLRALAWAVACGVTWAGIEYFRSELWPLACPWLGLGYSQTYNPPVFQSLSVWGVYGLSAFMAAANAAWALTLRKSRLPAISFFAALILVTAWGRHRLNTLPAENGRPVKVALVQAERAPISELARLSLTPEAAGADLLVWPECSVMMPAAGSPAYAARLARELKGSRAEAVVGVCVDENKAAGVRRANYTLLLGRDKKISGVYDKMHPVQFVETGLPENKTPAPVTTALGRLGPQICYDLAFEDGTRRITEQGAQLLIVPTLDPMEWTELQHRQHSDMSAARAVESGLWLVRSASSGYSQVIDRLGGVRAELAAGKRGALTAEAYIGNGGTFYTRAGWVFAPFAFAFALAAAAGLALLALGSLRAK